MSHHIFHTNAFILSSRNQGEANKSFTLFTRELGVVRATAQGVRHLKSKLRYSLQDLSFASVDLVRGKDIWRVTSAKPNDHFRELKADKKILSVIANAGNLLRRLYRGEDPNPELYDHVERCILYIEQEKKEGEVVKDIELILVLGILYHLGYVEKESPFDSLVTGELSRALLMDATKERKKILDRINTSIRETQL